MEITKSMGQLVDGLALLGMTTEIITAVLAVCNTEEKRIEMMLWMADKIDENQKITAEEIFHKAVRIAQG